jgi:hypothetical protein
VLVLAGRRADSTARAGGWTRRQPQLAVAYEVQCNQLGVDRRRSPCRRGQQGDRVVVSRYSGIQTPKSQKPHWLKPGSHTGVTVYPQ